MRAFAAIIPVRQNPSQGKDALADLGGRPILYHSVIAAREAGLDLVVVSSTDEQVCACAARWGVAVLRQPERLAVRGVTAEEVVLHALDGPLLAAADPDYVVLLPPEMPLRRPGRVAAACAEVRRQGADCLFSCCRERPLLWKPSPGGLIPFYDPQRRQLGDASPAEPAWHRENGSIYISGSAGLRRTRNRLFGKITTLEMDSEESLRAVGSAGLVACRAMLAHIRSGSDSRCEMRAITCRPGK